MFHAQLRLLQEPGALGDDVVPIVDFLFEQPGWVLIELASQHENSQEMNAPWQATRIDFNPGVGARFRYDCQGWGLIQLYLHLKERRGRLDNCHSNHNSPTRASNWQAHARELGHPDTWDFKVVTSMSSKPNRFIRKQDVAKRGSRPILPRAHAALAAGKIVLG